MEASGGRQAANGKLLTISVAAYNVEPYIAPTLEKLCASRQRELFEVLVIDDGGSDGTLAIAEEYQKRFPDVVIPVHKENGGWGSTVNTAVRMAQGRYLKLLDGDDYFDPEGLDAFLEALKITRADLVYTPVAEFDDATDGFMRIQPLAKDYPADQDLDMDVLNTDLGITMHGCAFRTQMLRDHRVTLTEHSFYADFEYLVMGLGACRLLVTEYLLQWVPAQHCTFYTGGHMRNIFQYPCLFKLLYLIIRGSALYHPKEYVRKAQCLLFGLPYAQIQHHIRRSL